MINLKHFIFFEMFIKDFTDIIFMFHILLIKKKIFKHFNLILFFKSISKIFLEFWKKN